MLGEQQLIPGWTPRAHIGRNAFAEQWRYPERPLSVVNEEQLCARWGSAFPAELFHERHPLDLWMFAKPSGERLFDDGQLVPEDRAERGSPSCDLGTTG
jgi:hypothetical protein